MDFKFKNLKYAFRCLGIIVKRHPLFLLLSFIELIVLVISNLIPINLVSKIVNLYLNNAEFTEIVFTILLNTSIYLIGSIIYEIVNFQYYYIESHFRLSFSIELYNKLKQIDYEFYQSPNFLDNYTRALDDGADKIFSVAMKQVTIIQEVVKCLFVLSIVFTVSKIAVLYSVAVAIVYLFLKKKSSQLAFESLTKQRPFMRIEWGISFVYYMKNAIPDIKTTDINNVMREERENANTERLRIFKNINKKKAIIDAISQALMSSIFPVILLFVAISTIKNKSIESLASLTVAATTIYQIISKLISTITQIQVDALESKVTFEVLDMDSNIENNIGIDIQNEFKSLSINNMSFGYDEKLILNNINVKFEKGQKIAIVGTNGAGKTTLVKLLLRLYDPKNGSIKFNDIDYKDINVKSLRSKIGAVFQNPEVYSVTVGENVLLKKIETKEEEDKVVEALKFADIYDYIMTLPDGINTMVTREFIKDGAVFSGGQLQKIAVARGYCQNYEVLLLDEPSSRLDPLAEAKMYQNMLKMGEGKTLVFISHRLSATIKCDKILLFEQGQIIEQGTHNELMQIKGGKYKEMFESQSEKYIGDKYD